MDTKTCNSEILIIHHQLGQKTNITTHHQFVKKRKTNKQTFSINQNGNITWNPSLSGICN